jgi:hypothetical protein
MWWSVFIGIALVSFAAGVSVGGIVFFLLVRDVACDPCDEMDI